MNPVMDRLIRVAALLGLVLLCAELHAQSEAPADSAPSAPSSAPAESQSGSSTRIDDLLELDLEQLGQIVVREPPRAPVSTDNVPSTTLDLIDVEVAAPSSTGELLELARSVSVRRTSSINLDPRVRGYHSEQLNASADGVTLRKTRIDIDSLFSQIDPGLVSSVTVIDGPYSSLYGPGYAFLIAYIFEPQRYDAPELRGRTVFQHETNGRQLYWRESLWGGGQDWGFYASYGQRVGNDYKPGRNSFDFRVPSSYNQWDSYLALSRDVNEWSRLDFSYLRSEQNNVELPGVAYDLNHSHTDKFNLRWTARDDDDGPDRAMLQYWYARTPYSGDASRPGQKQLLVRTFATNNLLGLAPPLDVFNVANTVVDGAVQSQGFRGFIRLGDEDATSLILGADWRRYTQRHFENTLNALGQPALTANSGVLLIPGVNDGPPDYRGVPGSSQEDWGLFVDLETAVTERLDLHLGGRIDFTSNYVDTSDPIAIGSFFVTQVGTKQPSELVGLAYVSANYQLTSAVQFETGVGFARRSPSLSEYYSDVPSSPILRFPSPIFGSSQLEPENNLQFDMGLSGDWDRVKMSVRGYHSTISNYILPIPNSALAMDPTTTLGRRVEFDGAVRPQPDTALVVYKYANVDRATLFGGDASIDVKVQPWLTVFGHLAYVKGTNHAPVGGLQQQGQPDGTIPSEKSAEALPNIYPLNATVGFRLFESEGNRWSIGMSSTMVMGQEYVADNLGELPTPGFTTFGLHGHLELFEGVTLRSAISNLFDRSYSQHGSLAIINPAGQVSFVKEPGISWTIGIEANY